MAWRMPDLHVGLKNKEELRFVGGGNEELLCSLQKQFIDVADYRDLRNSTVFKLLDCGSHEEKQTMIQPGRYIKFMNQHLLISFDIF